MIINTQTNEKEDVMKIDEDRKRLKQDNNLKWIGRDLNANDMLIVYKWDIDNLRQDYFILSSLIPSDFAEEVLSKKLISNVIENVWPEPAAYSTSEENIVKYFRWGINEDLYGAEPLVIGRQFSQIKESYFEISEEFRLFHNLYHDQSADKYIKIDDAGNEEIVAIVNQHEVQIRYKEIRQFLAVKEMYLSMLFEFNEYSKYTLEELELNETNPEFSRQDLMFWRHGYYGKTPFEEFSSDSRLRGRRLIEPLPKSKSGFGDFSNRSDQYEEFIIDVDEDGNEISHTCNPDKLENLGKNPDDPCKYTPVYFRKQVLDKYYNETGKYRVEDSMVSCASLWSMKIDNDHTDKVCVLLSDLGISLPYTEQRHWKSHNISPGGGVSRSFFERNFEGKWVNSDLPDHLFKQNYRELQRVCEEYLGWQILKPLKTDDEYRINRLRVLTVDEESHFKDSILDLAIILIERLNVKCLKQLIPANIDKSSDRSIKLLESVLNSYNVINTAQHISFLQNLWDLRSTRGGSHPSFLDDPRYKRASDYFDLENLNRPEAFNKILGKAVEFLTFLISVVESGKFSNQTL